MFLSRQQYNAMVERYPQFMAYDWPKFQKEWSLGGVYVHVPEHAGYAHALKLNARTIGWK